MVTNMYYIQQQSRIDKVEEEDESEWAEEAGEIGKDEPLPPGSVSVFSVLCRDGVIDESFFDDDCKKALDSLKDRLPVIGGFSSDDIVENSLICSSFSGANVPILWYKDGSWEAGNQDVNEFVYHGDNTTAGSNNISNVYYYSYRGQSPFFAADHSYNTAVYGAGDETRMSRFVFYRFTGETALPDLDNYLVAVDSYTRLFFSFGIPTGYDDFFGQKVPNAWGPVDLLCADSDGNTHKFYEYDPAGYIDDDGDFVRMEWYNQNLGNANYNPVYTGRSPYSVLIQTGADIVPTIVASSVLVEVPLSDDDGFLYPNQYSCPAG